MTSRFVFTLCIVLCLGSCTLFEQQRNSGVLVEYKGATITRDQLDCLTQGLSPEDSTAVADQYIKNWAINLIEYDVAKRILEKDIEQLVEDYRHSLYVHEYEREIVEVGMSKVIEDSLVVAFYNEHIDYFILQETILQGLLLVIPNGAPNKEELYRKIQQPDAEENIEWIEKYAYQYAIGYELFLDEWNSLNKILIRTPFDEKQLLKHLKQKQTFTSSDSTHNYILQVTNACIYGDPIPIEYARQDIEKIMLNQRQVNFILSHREALYKKTLQQGKLKRYEK